MRKKKKLILRLLAFGIAFELVLVAALLLDIPRTSQALVEPIEIGRVGNDMRQSQNADGDESTAVKEGALDEEGLTGAGLDDSMYVDPIDPSQGSDMALDETIAGPEPYDFGSGSDPSFEDMIDSYPAPGSGSYDDTPADDGEGGIGADFDDYGDTAGCDGDCDDYDVPPVDEDPAIPTPIPFDDVSPTEIPTQPAPTVVSPTQAPTARPTIAPTSAPTQPAPRPTAAPTRPAPQPTPTKPPAQPTPTTPPEQPPQPSVSGGLIAVPAAEAPALDGNGGDAAWASAPEWVIETTGGANDSAARVSLRAVYDSRRVYFLVSWEDPSNSWLRNPWEKQPDGSWKRLAGPDNQGNDENQYYEDKLALLWPVNESIPGFDTQGCGTACHLGEGDKPLGSMHTNNKNQLADLWNWKSYRNIGQVDDLYLNSDDSKDEYWAGLHMDPNDGGGYSSNIVEGGEIPAYMLPAGGPRDGSPGFIYAPDKAPFDDSIFAAGDRLPSVIAEPFLGDRGDISAGWVYADGRWTLEFSRALVTGSRYDVQFEDFNKVYYFALATFDNTQVRHAAQAGATPFRFQK